MKEIKIGIWFKKGGERIRREEADYIRDWVEQVIEDALADDGGDEIVLEGWRFDGATLDVGPGRVGRPRAPMKTELRKRGAG